jgi:hypothetical protein
VSRSLGNIIADSLELGLGYAERLLEGVEADDFGRFASTGRVAIQSNHPAFIFGHLSLYAPQVIANLGKPTPEVPDGFTELFSKDATCQDDGSGELYPAQDQITSFFFAGYRVAVEALRGADNGPLEIANPTGGRMTELFPTVGSMLAFYCGGHFMMHMGQLSAWRRMKGLGPS